jgi:hypothetical protein
MEPSNGHPGGEQSHQSKPVNGTSESGKMLGQRQRFVELAKRRPGVTAKWLSASSRANKVKM